MSCAAVLKYLVEECGVDVNATSLISRTPLFAACAGARMDVVRYLAIDCKADIELTATGATPLYVASGKGSIETVRFLVLECNADVHAEVDGGYSTILGAASNGHVDVIKFLVECGVSPHRACDFGWSPIHFACSSGTLVAAKFLLAECSVDVEVEDDDGCTPLLVASQSGHHAMIEYLADRGANVHHETEDGETALSVLGFNWENSADYKRSAEALAVLKVPMDYTDLYPTESILNDFAKCLRGRSQLEIAVACRKSELIRQMFRSRATDMPWQSRTRLLAIASAESPWATSGISEYGNFDIQTRELVQAASVAWSPATHSLMHSGVRSVVMTIMLLQQRLQWDPLSGIAAAVNLPLLPLEVWIHVLSFTRRSHFAVLS
jgi:hypothetical protein